MHIEVDNSYRFIRNAEQQEKMIRLRDLKIFPDYSKIMMVSAIIGFKNNAYINIENKASDRVQLQFFQPADLDIIDLFAYAHAKDQKILNSIEKYHIFESYVNGGFPILYDRLGVTDETTIEKRKTILIQYYNMVMSPKGFEL